jgi:hypothetical protein
MEFVESPSVPMVLARRTQPVRRAWKTSVFGRWEAVGYPALYKTCRVGNREMIRRRRVRRWRKNRPIAKYARHWPAVPIVLPPHSPMAWVLANGTHPLITPPRAATVELEGATLTVFVEMRRVRVMSGPIAYRYLPHSTDQACPPPWFFFGLLLLSWQ